MHKKVSTIFLDQAITNPLQANPAASNVGENSMITTEPAKDSLEKESETSSLKTLKLSPGTILGYKVITNDRDDETENINIAFGRTEEQMKNQTNDFSATYINKDPYTALSYALTKLNDQGCKKIQLVQIIVKKDPLDLIKSDKYIDLCDKKVASEQLSSELKTLLGLSENSQLLHEIGTSKKAALLTYDADSIEVAYPHTLDLKFITVKTIGKMTTREMPELNEVKSLTFTDLINETPPSDENTINQSNKLVFTTKPLDEIQENIKYSKFYKIIDKQYPAAAFDDTE